MIEIRPRSEILLVGGAGTLSGLPEPLRQRFVSAFAVQRLSGDTQALARPLTVTLRAAPPAALALNRMTLGEQLDDVLRRTAGRPPRAVGNNCCRW